MTTTVPVDLDHVEDESARGPTWDRVSDPLRRRPGRSTIVTMIAVAGSSLFVLWQMRIGLLLANTTPAGGDMGAHVWAPAFLRDHLLPSGRLSGWSPDWYLGFPALQFYFPLPSLLIVVLDLVLPYGVAFKLVTVSGVVGLPVAAWAFGRLAGMRFPGPACLAVATLPFLFDRTFTIYGGNIASTLAGEFSFTISLCLALVFLGLVARGLDDGKRRALAAATLALCGLCHVVPAFFALMGLVVMLLFRPDRQRLRWVFGVGLVAALLAAFWTLPFLARIAYTNDMGWEKIVTYRKDLFPPSVRWVPVLGAIGALLSVVRRRRTGTALGLMALCSGAAFVLAPQSRLWNARLLPFWFLTLYLLAGVAVAEIAHLIAESNAHRRVAQAALPTPDTEFAEHTIPVAPRAARPDIAEIAAPLVALGAALLVVALPLKVFPSWFPVKTADRSFIPDWVKWNYSGYERKPAFPEYQDLVSKMKVVGQRHGCGRAMWEYEPQLDRLGTPMALMLLPYWTDGCIGSMEGLFFESSASTPYHFLNQSELSQEPSRAQRDLPYRELGCPKDSSPSAECGARTFDHGIRHLQLLGVRYYLALSPEAREKAARHPALRSIEKSGPWTVNYSDGSKERTWEVYVVEGASVVSGLQYEPVVMTDVPKGGRAWLDVAVAWYQDEARWDVPLATSGPAEWVRVRGAPPNAPKRAFRAAAVSHVRMSDDTISFDVDHTGSPVLVKASYFPNWKASGARGPWRVTPNLMVVIPTAQHVELSYGMTGVDGLAWSLTFAGFAGLVILRRRGEVAYAAPTPGDSEPSPVEPPEVREPLAIELSDERLREEPTAPD